MPRGRSIYTPRTAYIKDVSAMTGREKLFTIEMEDGSMLGHSPGQFVEVSVFGVGEAPISVSSSPSVGGSSFELCIRDAGSVTGVLHRMEKGAAVGIRGPFGRGFPVDELRGRDVMFVAGGLGLAPLRSIVNYCVDNRADFGELTLLYGARTPSDMLYTGEYDRWKATPGLVFETTVDLGDGVWSGNVGVITGLLESVDINPERLTALVVGPPVMFRFVLKSILARGVYESRIFLSLERRMKCGVGKCGHCQIDDVYVCRKGPVFAYNRVRSLKEAL